MASLRPREETPMTQQEIRIAFDQKVRRGIFKLRLPRFVEHPVYAASGWRRQSASTSLGGL